METTRENKMKYNEEQSKTAWLPFVHLLHSLQSYKLPCLTRLSADLLTFSINH